MDLMPSYYKYWGKADPDYPYKPKWHPLIYHCLDVAAMATPWRSQIHMIRYTLKVRC